MFSRCVYLFIISEILLAIFPLNATTFTMSQGWKILYFCSFVISFWHPKVCSTKLSKFDGWRFDKIYTKLNSSTSPAMRNMFYMFANIVLVLKIAPSFKSLSCLHSCFFSNFFRSIVNHIICILLEHTAFVYHFIRFFMLMNVKCQHEWSWYANGAAFKHAIV